MYKKMLIPLDGSELAEAVFVYAKELAGRFDADMTFLNVCTPEERDLLPMHRAYVKRVADTLQQRAEQVRQRLNVGPEGSAPQAHGEVAVGYPAEEIVRYAEENGIDLIVLATHGRSGIGRWALGSVADKVLRASSIPVWLVQAGSPEETPYDIWPQRTILVPLDGSEMAESVLPHVEVLARHLGPEPVDVVLLRVCEYPVVPLDYAEGVPVGWEKQMEQESARSLQLAMQYLQTIEKQLSDKGIAARSEVLEGKPAEAIVGCATGTPFNLIAMVTHGRSGLSRWAYGSVTAKIIAGTSSPLLLIRPK